MAERLAGLDASARERELLTLVRTEVAAVLGLGGADAVDPGRTFRDIGFDSLTAVELRNRLNAATGLRLAAAVAFDQPTAHAIAAHIGAELAAVTGGARQAGETALAGLETLEAAVAALADDDIRRETLHRRLAVLVTALGGPDAGGPDAGGPAGGAGPDPLVTAPRDLAGVDDEELFAFIEEQL
ncbi:acyl carrier protein [Streptomyces werraensis]|uniref:acyl carrier protein n=1 Tax=Streptomyces werraensis TaxID=68284 RepID=UPI0033195B0C